VSGNGTTGGVVSGTGTIGGVVSGTARSAATRQWRTTRAFLIDVVDRGLDARAHELIERLVRQPEHVG
jgi:hypothetical protein